MYQISFDIDLSFMKVCDNTFWFIYIFDLYIFWEVGRVKGIRSLLIKWRKSTKKTINTGIDVLYWNNDEDLKSQKSIIDNRRVISS